jgi:hypothetical protein
MPSLKAGLFQVTLLGFTILAQKPNPPSNPPAESPRAKDPRKLIPDSKQIQMVRYAGQPAPRFANGMLVARHTPSISTSRISRWDTSGRQLPDVNISMPNVARTIVSDAAVHPKSGIVLALTAVSENNRGAPLLLWADQSGKVVRAVETSPFAANRIVFSEDGTLWTFGREFDAGLRDVPEYNVIRRYDQTGKLIGSTLPRSSFAGKMAPHITSHLVSSGNKVGILSLTKGEWIELDLQGKLLGRWKINPRPGELVTGVALGRPGQPWMSVQWGGKGSSPMRFGLCRLDPTSGDFVELDSSSLPKSPSTGITVLDSEGENRIVLRIGDAVQKFTVQ